MKEPSKETTQADSSPYRRVFVGREAELGRLKSAFDGASWGHGALTMVMGEPGIGKTALCDRLTAYVALQGGRTLTGYCYEEGSRSLPYLAFVEALGPYVLSREDNDLRQELGAGAADVARIVPEVGQRLGVRPRPQRDPEEERYRLLQAVTGFLANIAAGQPLLLVLEDLHDADRGTLDMLTHVSRHLAGTRLLVVGTYRDVEVDRTHLLSAALAELRRVSSYDRVLLRGLSPEGVRHMMESITGESLPWGLAAAVHRQTEGNPLFVQEVVRYLNEQKLLIRASGKTTAAPRTSLDMSIPEGLRDVIGKRLSNLSKECNRLLSVAAVIGREFRLDILQKVAGLTEDEMFASIEEAKRVAIVEERSSVGATATYRFAHAFFRTTLYEENIAPRRIRLHQQIARALEEAYANRLQEHAAELAEHFSYSTEATDLTKAIDYGEMAARRATGVYDYGEAVRLLEQALKVQEVLDPGDRIKLCDLQLELCEALLNAGEFKRVLDTEVPAAFSAAERAGDGLRAARAALAATRSVFFLQGTAGIASPQFAEWAARADRNAPPGTPERARTDVLLGSMHTVGVDRRFGAKLLTRALELARSLGDPLAVQAAASGLYSLRTAPQHAEENRQLAEEVLDSLQSQVNPLVYAGFVNIPNIAHTFLIVGQRQRAEAVWSQIRTMAERTGRAVFKQSSLAADGYRAIIDGRLSEAMAIAEQARAFGNQSDTAAIAVESASAYDFRARIHLGESLDHPDLLPTAFLGRVASCLVQAHTGRRREVSQILDELVVRRAGIGSAEDESPAWADVVFLEASVLTGHHEAAELLAARLGGLPVRTSGRLHTTCVARHLGGAAAMLGQYEPARAHYQEALRVSTEMRFRPELALTRLQLAELLLEHYPAQKKEALEQLDFAIKEFREMKMQPSLERAWRILTEEGRLLAPQLEKEQAQGTAPEYASQLLSMMEAEERHRKPASGQATPFVSPSGLLSQRELQILRLVASGLSNRQIADKLMISLGTAKTHVHNIFEKLNAKSRTEAIARARELGLT